MGVTRANSYEEIAPLIKLSRAGKLFEVQAWIKTGKPVNSPTGQHSSRKRPVQWAIDLGFHSLVEVLLKAGTELDEGDRYSALHHALREKRLDLVQLLMDHGADVKSVDMRDVFETYDPELMEFFIEQGADCETGNPLALAFCHRIRPALRIFKQYKDRFRSFQEQANIALRYHCREGSQKWISLMLWAGADPCAAGSSRPDQSTDADLDVSALECAALYGHIEVFQMRQIRLDPKQERAFELIRAACFGQSSELLRQLVNLGYPLNDQPKGGSSLIGQLLQGMTWYWRPDSPTRQRNIDTDEAREKMKMLHLIVKHGARWIPEKPCEIRYARAGLLKMIPDYTAELVWIMTAYGGCDRRVIVELLRTPSIHQHVEAHRSRIEQLVMKLDGRITKPHSPVVFASCHRIGGKPSGPGITSKCAT